MAIPSAVLPILPLFFLTAMWILPFASVSSVWLSVDGLPPTFPNTEPLQIPAFFQSVLSPVTGV